MSRRIYKPMLAKVAAEPFSGKDWVFEVKWDGFRAIAYVDGQLSVKSRNQKELLQNFPELAELKNLCSNVVLDGEIIVMYHGKPDFQALLERGQAVSRLEIQRQTQQVSATYIVFDILEKDARSLVDLPLMERKKILKDSLREGANVFVSDFIEEKGEAYFKSAVDKGLEGLIAKRKDSLYEEGRRSGSWLKIKKLKSCDCVIFGYTKGANVRAATFGALLLGLYDKDGKPVYVGKVGTGFSQKTLQELYKGFENLKTDVASFKPEAGDEVVWLKPQLVCEVIYQTLTRDNRLRMARFQRLRTDKTPKECTVDQLAEEKLSKYAAKRDFKATPEPLGGGKKGEGLIFVIQEHNARRLHFDLRLENGGVLRSWAVPKGMPENSGEKRLAVETEDHPLDYANFEGSIPKGQYGAGTVKIWDKGEYEPKIWDDSKIEFALKGERLKGRYVLVRLKRAGDKSWLLLKGRG